MLAAGLIPGSPRRVLVDPAIEAAPAELGESVASLRVVAEPIALAKGARVRVFAVNETRSYFVAEGKLDVRGETLIPKLTIGVHWVVVDAPGSARSSTMVLVEKAPRVLAIHLEPEHIIDITVTRDDESPIADAEVEVSGSGDPVPVGARTGADGHVRVAGLGKAPWQVRARASGFEPVLRRAETEGQPVRIALHRLGTLVVHVLVANREPATNATVWLASSVLGTPRMTQSNAEGNATVSGLPAGAYALRAQRDGLVSATELGVVVALGSSQSVTLQLGPGRMIPVRVVDAENEKPLSAANVVVIEEGISPFPAAGTTDPNGRVTLGPFVRDVDIAVRVMATGFVAYGPARVPPGSTEEIVAKLQRAATIEGRVVDARGFPIDGASLEIIGTNVYGGPVDDTQNQIRYSDLALPGLALSPTPLVPAGELGVMPGPVPPIPRGLGASVLAAPLATNPAAKASWVSRKDGTFILEPVAAGELMVVARQPQYTEAMSDPIAVRPGGRAEVTIVMMRGGSIEGRVMDTRRNPVAGAHVRLVAWHGDRERVAKSGTDGVFAFAAVPSKVTLLVGSPDDPLGVAARIDVVVPEDKRREVEITLPEAREALPVRVRDRRGFPIDSVQISALSVSAESGLRRTVFTDARGETKIPGARGVPIRIEARAPKRAPLFLELDASASAAELTMSDGERLTGDVRDQRGFPIAQASVRLQSAHETRNAITNRDGTFAFGELGDGEGKVRIRAKGYAQREMKVNVARRLGEGATDVGRIELLEEGAVQGRVVNAKGEPVPGARVALGTAPTFVPVGAPIDEDRTTAVTDGKGEFELRELREGLVDIEAYSAAHGRGKAPQISVRGGKTTSDILITLVNDEWGGTKSTHLPGSVAVTLGESSSTSEVILARVAESSEASRAGLVAGDVLLDVDGVGTRTIVDARSRLDGPIGVDVVLHVKRGHEDRKVRLKRERVRR